jgi:hypothetical protein
VLAWWWKWLQVSWVCAWHKSRFLNVTAWTSSVAAVEA